MNFINDGKHMMEIDDLKIILSPKTETFFNLLKKNGENKAKFKEVVKNVFFSENKQGGNKFLIDMNL